MGIIKIEHMNYIPLHLTKETTNGYTLQNELTHGVIGEKGKADYHIYNALTIYCESHYNLIIKIISQCHIILIILIIMTI